MTIAMERVQAAALTPESVMRRLDDLERDLASRQGELEAAAYAWFVAKRERERLAKPPLGAWACPLHLQNVRIEEGML